MLSISEAAARLRSFDRVLILTHVRPDGDTVGCAAALCAGLRAIGKTAYLLPNPQLTENTAPYFAPYEAPENFEFDKVVSVDVAAAEILTDKAKPLSGRIDLAIDHHPSFEHFGRENLVRPEAAACGEILYEILAELGPITPEIALPLYVAISTDTGCFAYSNTTAHTHNIAARLMETGIDYRDVNKKFFRTKSRKRMQLEAAMLNDCEFYDGDRIAVLSVPLDLIQRLEATESDAEDLAALGGQIQGVDCAVTMRELQPCVWKLSVRTGPRVNATEVCQKFGGGGHAAASGCKIKGPREEAVRQILAAIREVAGE